MKLSASSVTANSCLPPQRSQKSQNVAGLEAGVDGAAAIGHRDAAAPLRRRARRSRASSTRGDLGIAGVAQDVEVEAIADAGRIESRHHRRRDCGSPAPAARCGRKIRIAVEAVIGSSPRMRADRRDDAATGSRRKAHDQEADQRRSRSRSPIQGSVIANNSSSSDIERRRSRRPTARRPRAPAGRRWSTATSAANSTRRPDNNPVGTGAYAQIREYATLRHARQLPYARSVRAGYSRRRGFIVQSGASVAGGRGDGAGALVCRARPGRNPRGAAGAARRRRGARARALRRAQPRAPRRWSLPAGCRRANIERMRAPFMGGRFPVPGEIRLRHGRPGRGRAGGAARPHGLRAASAPDHVQSAGRRRRAGARRRAAAARGAGRQHGDGAQRDLGCGAGPGRPDRGGRRRRGRRAGRLICARGIAGAEVTLVDIDPARGGSGRGRSASNFATPDAAPSDCDCRVPRQRHARPGLRTALVARRRRSDRARAELVRRRRRCRCRSAARSTAAG